MDYSTPPIDGPRQSKISCRHLWKIFGENPKAALDRVRNSVEEKVSLNTQLGETRHFAALVDVNFDVLEGEIFVVMGLSGSGKSTLVRCLSRLVEPTAGQVFFEGENLLAAGHRRLIDIRRKSIGMVFQNFGLLPHLNVIDNVAFPLRVQGISPAQRHKRAEEMVRLVGLSGKEQSYPPELSGGQQQRVGIARSLAVGPALWFLDEPFSALDPLIRREMQDEFLRLQKMLHKTIVFITHDIHEAFRLADRLAIMRDGRIVQIGTPAEIILNPVDDYVARFMEDVSLAQVLRAKDVMVIDRFR